MMRLIGSEFSGSGSAHGRSDRCSKLEETMVRFGVYAVSVPRIRAVTENDGDGEVGGEIARVATSRTDANTADGGDGNGHTDAFRSQHLRDVLGDEGHFGSLIQKSAYDDGSTVI